uniref:protein-serine/threonine phosphatase n=1 Tax=Schistocephalus solidus TaxID=70667 RepID=A0A0V0J959_SCHSO
MGAYLSRPKTEKETTSGANSWLSYGASSMQGWRRFQEDAHNCLLDFDPKRKAAYFAVYDGHGGAEVAKYCAAHLPDFLREQPAYTEEPVNPTAVLKNAFVDFDCTLVSPEVKSKLWSITNSEGEGAEPAEGAEAPEEDGDDDDDEVPEGLEEVAALHDEASKPIEYVLKQYGESLLSSFKSNGDKTKASESNSAEQSDGLSSSNADAETSKNEKASSEVADEDDESQDPTRKVSTASSLNAFSDRPLLVDEDEVEVVVPGPSSSTCKSKSKAPKTSAVDKTAENEEDDDEDDRDYQVGDEEDDDDDGAEDEDVEGCEDDDEEEEEEEEEEESGEEEYEDEDEDDYTPSHFFAPKPVAYNEPGVDSGTTACVALLLPEVEDGERRRVCLYVANAGDSRAVLCRARAAVDLSTDHKPEDAEEKARIVAAGGTVTADGRVNDGLNLSRALGDHTYKCRKDLKMADQMISALPDVTKTELIPGNDDFLVIACDGIWNSMSSQEVVDFIYDRLHPEEAFVKQPERQDNDKKVEESTAVAVADGPAVDGEQQTSDKPKESDHSSPTFLSTICEALFDRCLAPNTMGDGTGCDNMTCIIVRFDDLDSLATCAVTRTTTKEVASVPVKSPNASILPSQRKRSESTGATEPAVASALNGDSAISAGADTGRNGPTVKLNGSGDEAPASAATAASCVMPPIQKKPRTEAEITTSPISRSPVAQPVNGSA